MKNLFKSMMLVAVAAMGFTACSNSDVNEVVAPSKQTKKITVVSDITRTEFNSDLSKLVWSEGDTFAVFTDVATDLNIQSSAYAAEATDFGLEVDATATKVYAYYPHYSGNSSKTATEMSVGIPGTQTQSIAGQLTSGNLPMVAQGTIEGDVVALSFRPIATVLGFNIYGDSELTENIVSIKFTAAGEEKSSGYDYTYNLTNSEEVYTPAYQYTTLNLSGDAQFVPGATKAENPQAYMVVSKANYSAGVEILVTTEGGTTYTFTTTQAIDCTETYRTMNLNLSKAVKVVPEEVIIEEGNYVIMVNYNNTYYALSAEDASSDKRRAAVAISDYTLGAAYYSTTNENIVWNLSQTEGGFYLTSNGDFLYGTDKQNYARVGTTTDIIKINDNEDGTYQFVSSNNTTEARNLALNSNVGTHGEFSFYKVGTTTGSNASTYADDIYLIPAIYTAIPSISVDNNTITLTAEEDEGTITITTKNVEGSVTATLGGEYDWFLAEINEDGNLYYIASANTSTERSATVTLSAEGADDVVITFTQSEYIAPSGDETSITKDFSTENTVNGNETATFLLDTNISIVLAKSNGTTAPTYNSGDGGHIRLYQNSNGNGSGSTMTVTATNEKTISKIEITYASDMNYFSVNTGTLSSDKKTWTGTASSVIFTVNGTSSKQRAYIKTVKVTYK